MQKAKCSSMRPKIASTARRNCCARNRQPTARWMMPVAAVQLSKTTLDNAPDAPAIYWAARRADRPARRVWGAGAVYVGDVPMLDPAKEAVSVAWATAQVQTTASCPFCGRSATANRVPPRWLVYEVENKDRRVATGSAARGHAPRCAARKKPGGPLGLQSSTTFKGGQWGLREHRSTSLRSPSGTDCASRGTDAVLATARSRARKCHDGARGIVGTEFGAGK